MLITEEPNTYYTALDLPPKSMATIQWDMYEAETIGFYKYGTLSQRGIKHIKMARQQWRKSAAQDRYPTGQKLYENSAVNANLKIGNAESCLHIVSVNDPA